MGLNNLIANGGRVLVVGGHWNKGWDSFKNHPALIWWNGEQKDISRYLKNNDNRLPDNVKGVILSRFISHSESSIVLKEARKKHILIMGVLNDGEITNKISEIVEKSESTVIQSVPIAVEKSVVVSTDRSRGWQKRFIQDHHQSDLITSKEGERLFKLAEENKLSTTLGSMQQAVGVYRKKLGIVVGDHYSLRKPISTSTPPSPVLKQKKTEEPTSEIEIITKMVDDAIAGLRLIRENISKLHRRDAEFTKLKERLARLVKDS